MQTSMSGIIVSDDAVNMYYYLKAKSTVRTDKSFFRPVQARITSVGVTDTAY